MVRFRPWRRANPHISSAERKARVAALLRGRRAVRDADTPAAITAARAAVDAAKVAPGERGPAWWDDNEDLDHCLTRNTGYAGWYAALDGEP